MGMVYLLTAKMHGMKKNLFFTRLFKSKQLVAKDEVLLLLLLLFVSLVVVVNIKEEE